MKKKQSISQRALKQNNIGIVLDEIKREKRVVKSVLSRRLRLSFATVSSICDILHQQGFVNMDAVGDSTGGRKPRNVLFEPSSRFIVSLDFSVQEALHIALINFEYKLVWNEWLQGIYDLPIEEILKRIQEAVEKIVDEANIDKERIIGAGAAVPGMYDRHHDKIYLCTNSSFGNISLKKRLEYILHIPVTILNDANLAALGLSVSAGQGQRNLLLVYFTQGVGLGVINNGEIFYGANGFAGEIGNVRIPIDNTGRKVEELLNRWGILKNYSYHKIHGRIAQQPQELKELSGAEKTDLYQQLITGCREGAPAEIVFIEHIGMMMGWLVATLIDIMNPDTIYLGGNIEDLLPYLIPSIQEYVRKNSNIAKIMDIPIEAASVENLIVAGTGELVYRNWMKRTYALYV